MAAHLAQVGSLLDLTRPYLTLPAPHLAQHLAPHLPPFLSQRLQLPLQCLQSSTAVIAIEVPGARRSIAVIAVAILAPHPAQVGSLLDLI